MMDRHDASRTWFCWEVGSLSAPGQDRLKAGISKTFDHARFGVDSRAAYNHAKSLCMLALNFSGPG